MAVVTFCAIIWGRVVTFLQYSRISTLSFLQVAFRSVSDSHLPKDHIHSHISTFIFTLYTFVLIYPCMLTPSCLNVRYIHLPARHLVFGAEKKLWSFILSLTWTWEELVVEESACKFSLLWAEHCHLQCSHIFLRAFQYILDIFCYIFWAKTGHLTTFEYQKVFHGRIKDFQKRFYLRLKMSPRCTVATLGRKGLDAE